MEHKKCINKLFEFVWVSQSLKTVLLLLTESIITDIESNHNYNKIR